MPRVQYLAVLHSFENASCVAPKFDHTIIEGVRIGVRCLDEAAAGATTPGLDDMFSLELADSQLDCGPTNAEHSHQFALGRKSCARSDNAEPDLASDLLHHKVMSPRLCDRRKLGPGR